MNYASNALRPLHKIFAFAAALTFPMLPASGDIVLRPVAASPGKSIRVVALTTSREGTIQVEKDGRVSNGTITFSRTRDIAWSFREPGEDGTRRGMVSVRRISANSTITLEGKPEKASSDSPLNGKMLEMTKHPKRDWEFELDGSVPLRRIEGEIAELRLYLNREWFPNRQVKPGDSWEFDPAWIRALIERDLHDAKMIGTMNLRRILHTKSGDSAIIGISVRGTGAEFTGNGNERSAKVEFGGQMVVDLETMLDVSLKLSGTLLTSSGMPGTRTTVTLPLQLEVTKTLIDN